MEKTKGQELARLVSDMMNSYSANGDDFAKEITSDHRTLQQTTFKEMILKPIKIWAEAYDTNRFDARNEDTCRICSKIVQMLKDEGEEHIRFI